MHMASYLHFITVILCFIALLSGIYNSVSSVSRNLESVPPPDGGIGAPEVIMAQQYHGYHESQDYGSPKEFYSTTTTTKTGEG